MITTRRLRACLFDLDGTLIDSREEVIGAFGDAVEALTGHRPAPAALESSFSAGSVAAILRCWTGADVDELELEVYRGAVTRRADRMPLYRGVADTLVALAEAKVPLGVVTSASHAGATSRLACKGLLDHFETLIAAEDVQCNKPASEAAQLACRRLGVGPARTAYVGDQLGDMEFARAAGMTGVAAGWSASAEVAAAADVVAHEPLDLLDLFHPLRR